jgi:hypothetical protein
VTGDVFLVGGSARRFEYPCPAEDIVTGESRVSIDLLAERLGEARVV